MWFNNIIVYPLQTPFTKNPEEIQQALEDYHLKPCPPHARQSQGWISLFDQIDKKLFNIEGCYLLAAAKESRLLPPSIIQTVLNEKKRAFELTHQKSMRRAEILQLKEDIEFDLLPKAFCLQKKDYLYIDTVCQYLVIHSASANKASEIIALLTKTLGSLAATPLNLEANLNDLFSLWLSDPQSLPSGLTLQKKCVLVNSKDDKSQYNCKDIEQNKEEILTLIQQGYTVTSLELSWLDRIKFTLTEECLIKRIQSMDTLEETFDDHRLLETEQEKLAANFTLFAGEMRGLIAFLRTLQLSHQPTDVPHPELCVS